MENRITYEIMTEYYFELLTSETMKVLGSTKSKINKNKNGENLPHLKISEAFIRQLTMIINKIQKFCIYLFLINHLVQH